MYAQGSAEKKSTPIGTKVKMIDFLNKENDSKKKLNVDVVLVSSEPMVRTKKI